MNADRSPPPSIFRKIRNASAFLGAMRPFLQQRLSAQEARATVRRRIAKRELQFLSTVQATIFNNPSSPYLPLLRAAGCTFDAIHRLVLSVGLENALHDLKDKGVYITFEEFKGRIPIRRNGLEYRVGPEAFDNPTLRNSLTSTTSGSTGRGVQVITSLDHIANQGLFDVLHFDVLGMSHAPLLMWFSAFPGLLGPLFMLRAARAGLESAQVFDPLTSPPAGPVARTRQALMRKTFFHLLRSGGYDYPSPVAVPLDRPEIIARKIHDTLRTSGRCMFRTYMSMCSRVGLAAEKMGLDLSGAVFLGGGEPITPAKVRSIVASGARFYPTYHWTEFGFMGAGCLNPSSCNDIHIFLDAGAIIQGSRLAPGTGILVDAFYMTTLLPETPKVMLNVESDDYGVLEHHDCGCPFHDLGYTLHAKDIHSFCKLTGQGVTLVGNDAIQILEEELPARFGGNMLDYQLAEEELEDGQTAISLYVSPRISIRDVAEVRTFFLQTLAGGRYGNPFAAGLWEKTGAFRVLHSEPVRGRTGKLLPLHLDQRLHSKDNDGIP